MNDQTDPTAPGLDTVVVEIESTTAATADASADAADAAADALSAAITTDVAHAIDLAGARKPTIRWGALAWGLIFAAIAGSVLSITTDVSRRDDFATWFAARGPVEALLWAILALGALAVVFGIVGLLRRGERARAERALGTPR